MKPISSPLKIVDFAVTRMNYEFIAPEEPTTVQSFFDRYDLDIDFKIFRTDFLQIVITADINMVNDPVPGYKVSAEIVALFKLEYSESVTDDEKRSIEGFSSVYMALNSLRTMISSFTANAPFGKYILPSIDLNDLIRRKQESVQAANSMQKTKTKKIIRNKKNK